MPARVLLFTLVLTTPLMAKAGDLVELLQTRKCPDCQLTDVDLVHSDLRDADLRGAQLQRANLGHARLDGADLKKSNLQFTNLRGASLRGADLRGSTLYGTDLRQADLSGARLDDGALEQAYWQGAHGIKDSVRSHAALHNAGVTAAENGEWEQAEALFGAAIATNPATEKKTQDHAGRPKACESTRDLYRGSRVWKPVGCGRHADSRGSRRHWHPAAARAGSSIVLRRLPDCRHGAGRRPSRLPIQLRDISSVTHCR